MSDRMVVRGVRLATKPKETVDLVVEEGRIARVAEAEEAVEGEATVIDGDGALVLPGLVNAHAHLDKTMFGGPWVANPGLSRVDERIDYERNHREAHGLPSEEYISALVEAMIAAGTTHVRTHTDIDPSYGLKGVEAVANVARRYVDAITIEQVAFPQCGLLSNPGTLELLEEATRQGVGVVGSIDPAGIDQAPIEQLDAVFDLAARSGSSIDIHLHDDGSLGAWEFDQIIARTVDHGLGGRVAISHAFAIDHAPAQDRLTARLAEADVALVTAAIYHLPIPPLVRLAEAGVAVATGTDGIRDLWGPYGDGDMLERVRHFAFRSSLRTDEELELALGTATQVAARVTGAEGYGLEPGCWADFVLVNAEHAAEAVVTAPVRRHVVKRGRLVASNGAVLPRD